MTDKVQVEIKGDVATIVLNKPERLNALDNEMWYGIGEACRAVNAAPDVRVAMLMGAGGCFCAGLDVKAGSTLAAPPHDLPPAPPPRSTPCRRRRPWPASASTWPGTRRRSRRWSRSACRSSRPSSARAWARDSGLG